MRVTLVSVSHPDEDLVRGAYQALNNADIEGFLAAFAEDAVLHGSGGQLRGRAAIGDVVRQLIEQRAPPGDSS